MECIHHTPELRLMNNIKALIIIIWLSNWEVREYYYVCFTHSEVYNMQLLTFVSRVTEAS